MSTPFFARFLEDQKIDKADAKRVSGGRPPFVTLKYPSDDDEQF